MYAIIINPHQGLEHTCMVKGRHSLMTALYRIAASTAPCMAMPYYLHSRMVEFQPSMDWFAATA